MKTLGYAARHSHSDLKPMEFERRDPSRNELQIEIMFCGVCHSDVHQAKNEWKNTVYPCMPGHEIVGRVVKAGSAVSKYKLGDIVGVGCMVDSCHSCHSCKEGLEQYCEEGFLATYNGNSKTPKKSNLTFGGYSETITVREDFVLKIPKNLDPAAAAPILCAGVTTYSPMKHWRVGKGTKIGIVGLGGLGQMAVKIAAALGAEVTVITSSEKKTRDAKKLGAKNVIHSKKKKSLKDNEESLDFILSTIPQPHDVNPYFTLLKRDGVLTIVGCLAPLTKPLDMSKIVMQRKSLGSSLIGGIAETQEILDFCSKHKIASDIKLIKIDKINEAFEKVDKGEVDYRFVIDMASIKGKKPAKESVTERILDLVE